MAALRRLSRVHGSLLARRCLSKLKRRTGAELVEFALLLPVLLLILVGIIDFAFFYQRYEIITNAAREGARVGVLAGYTTTDAQDRALDYLDAAGLADARRTAVATPTTLTLPNGTQISAIQVAVTYPYDFLLVAPISALFGGNFGSRTLVASATMRTEAQAGS